MEIALLTGYILVWPVLSAIILAALTWGVLKDAREARLAGEQLV